MGRVDEGLAELKEAERLDPLSLAIKDDLGRVFYRARRYDEKNLNDGMGLQDKDLYDFDYPARVV
jgi:hypothetical protein